MAKQTLLTLIFFTLFFTFSNTLATTSKIKTTQNTIVIDPGHGGNDSGLISTLKVIEKDIVLLLSQKVAEKLSDHYNLILTRTDDTSLSSEQRVSIANQNNADLLVAVHLHNNPGPVAFGYFYALSDNRTNEDEISYSTWKFAQLKHQAQAQNVLSAFQHTFSSNAPDKTFYVFGAPLNSLQGATMPAIHIEPFHLSGFSKQQEDIEVVIEKSADLIAQSIHFYLSSIP